jgi:hypothetical protein
MNDANNYLGEETGESNESLLLGTSDLFLHVHSFCEATAQRQDAVS